MLWASIIKRLFLFQLILFCCYFFIIPDILGEFCDFTKVPDAPKPTRFKQDYLLDLQSVYDNFFDIN